MVDYILTEAQAKILREEEGIQVHTRKENDLTDLHEQNSVGGVTHGDGYAGRDDRCWICYPR